MPWSTPSLREVRILVRDQVKANLTGADASIPNSILRVLSDVSAGLSHLVLQYLDWLAKQLLPDTSEAEWLSRHAHIWLTNADGTTGRKLATLAVGQVALSGSTWTAVPPHTRLTADQQEYETTEIVYLSAAEAPTPTPVRALDPGAAGNLEPNSTITVINPGPGVNAEGSVISMDGGVDDETDDQLRARVLLRIRQPPMGGCATDYEEWALAVPGVTRAWCSALEMGIGTVSVRFMMDDLRADEDGFPRQADIDAVTAYLDTVRPVTVKDLFVLAPLRQPVHVQINRLEPDTQNVRAAIEVSLQAMLHEKAEPGQTIYSAWKSYSIMSAPGVESFHLVNEQDDFMESPGHMGVLGNISYG